MIIVFYILFFLSRCAIGHEYFDEQDRTLNGFLLPESEVQPNFFCYEVLDYSISNAEEDHLKRSIPFYQSCSNKCPLCNMQTHDLPSHLKFHINELIRGNSAH